MSLVDDERQSVLQYALESLVEYLKGPESADRAADEAVADRRVVVAQGLLTELRATGGAVLKELSTSRLLDELQSRGLVTSAWSEEDLDFLDEESWTAGLSDSQLATLKSEVLDRCGPSLKGILSERGNEHLATWCSLNQQELLSAVKDTEAAHDGVPEGARRDVVEQLAGMVISQAQEHGFPVEVDAIRDAVDQFAKFAGIDATELERQAASARAERLASDVVIRVQLSGDHGIEIVEFNALDVLKHHGETRTWQELVLDPSHQHPQISLAEDYALYRFRRRHGDMRSYEVDVLSGLTTFEKPSAPVPASRA